MFLSFFDAGLFHFRHLLALFISIVFIISGSIYSVRKLKINKVERILLYIGIVSETVKVFSYILMNEDKLGGYLPKTDLPFHLCSIQLIFIAILNFSANDKLKHLLHGFMIPTCLVGGAAAMILATSSSRSNPVIMVQYFMYHSAIVIFAIYLLCSKEIVFTIKDYRNTILFLFAIFFIAIYINSILYYKLDDGSYANINFMYVINPPEKNLPFLNKNHGWLVYISHYASLAVFVITLTYIKPIANYFKKK